MYISDNGNFKEGIIWWDTDINKNADVDVFFFIHDFDGRAEHKYGFKTLELDLTLNNDDRWKDYKSNLRNELRKSLDEKFTITYDNNPSKDLIKEFVENYNTFAKYKKLQKTTKDLLNQMNNDNKLVISKIEKEGKILAMHSYYVGGKKNRVRLYQSLSTNNNFTPKVNGYANKYLTDKDIEYFKDQGFSIYDFGGIGNVEGDNSHFSGIIKFKKAFGGKEKILWKGVTPNGIHGKKIYEKYWK